MKTYQGQWDREWMKKNPEMQIFKNFAFKGQTVFVDKNWIENNVDACDLELNEDEFYETTLSIEGFHSVEQGHYNLEIESDSVVFGDTNQYFKINIDGDWINFRPADHKGFYAEAKKLGY